MWGYCPSCGIWLWFHTETCMYWENYMAKRMGQESSPWDIYATVEMGKEPRDFTIRVMGRISDYELLVEQTMQILRLKEELRREREKNEHS